MNKRLIEVLHNYIPSDAVGFAVAFIQEHKIQLKITTDRKTKLGDYRNPFNGETHKISINGSLNKYAFLVTLIHEFAHLICWNQYRNNVAPHGVEWKRAFQQLLIPILRSDIFPEKIRVALFEYIQNPASSSTSDLVLMRTLGEYDLKEESVFIEDIPENAWFIMEDGRLFKKGPLLRKRYKCVCLESQQEYLFHPLAKILPIN